MSEKKHTTANTQSGSEEAFTSIDHIVLSDQVTAISITSNKIRFMIKRMLDTSDDISQDYDDGMEQFDVKFYVGMTEYSYDIDANTGGYNLHCAFSTGLLAGQSAAKSL